MSFRNRSCEWALILSGIATRCTSASVDLIEEEEMPLMDTSIPMDTSLASFTNSLQREMDEEVNHKKKVRTAIQKQCIKLDKGVTM